MAKLTKSSLSALISIVMVSAFMGCGRLSDNKTTAGSSNTNANDKQMNLNTDSSAAGAINLARLEPFVGSWGGYAGRSTAVAGKVGIDSRWMKVIVKRVTPETLALEGDVWQAKGTLKYDTNSDRYLLSLQAEDLPPVAELPMTFSDAEGFSGTMTFTNKGKEAQAKATIKDNKGESEWHLGITQGKDMWNLTIHLGKEQ